MSNFKSFGVIIAIFILVISVLDFINWDNITYLFICNELQTIRFISFCISYYDLPIWDVLTSFGTILAGYFAYRALAQSNKQLQAELTPYIVSGNIGNEGNFRKTIQLKNIGKGVALKLYLSSDAYGKHRIQHPSLPEYQYVEFGKEFTTLMLDEVISTKIDFLEEGEGITLYFWYQDIAGNKYRTISVFRKSGQHIKNITNLPIR
jgi:hypothetical protein